MISYSICPLFHLANGQVSHCMYNTSSVSIHTTDFFFVECQTLNFVTIISFKNFKLWSDTDAAWDWFDPLEKSCAVKSPEWSIWLIQSCYIKAVLFWRLYSFPITRFLQSNKNLNYSKATVNSAYYLSPVFLWTVYSFTECLQKHSAKDSTTPLHVSGNYFCKASFSITLSYNF